MEYYVEHTQPTETETSHSYTEPELGNKSHPSEEEVEEDIAQEYFDLPLNERIKIRSQRLKEKMDIKAKKFKIVADRNIEKAKVKTKDIHLKMQDKFARFQQKMEHKHARWEEKRERRMERHQEREEPEKEPEEPLYTHQPQEEFKFCPQCGNHVSLDGKFCATCGMSQ